MIIEARAGVDSLSAFAHRKRWVAEKLCPQVVVNLTRTARQKAAYAAPNHILIDDKMKAIKPWREAGGIGILHADAKIERTLRELARYL